MKITIPRSFALALVALFIGTGAFAQTSTITGVVRDTQNEPVIGATIMVKGTSTGVMTNPDGSYSIKAKASDVLVCQLLGYKNSEEAVNGRSRIDFVIEEDSEMLEATVVVGYGTLKKTQLVGAVENLSGEALEQRTAPNAARALQGQVAGLNIVMNDGKPTHSGSMYVRGNAQSYSARSSMKSRDNSTYSIGNGDTSALVLVDGVEASLSSVNPDDIETIAVLKDAASAAVYGARGAFGVVLVTTKKAADEKVTVRYNGTYSINQRTVLWEDGMITDGLVWSEEYAKFYMEDYRRVGAGEPSFPSVVNNKAKWFGQDYLEEFRQRRIAGITSPWGGTASDGTYKYFASTNWAEEFYKRSNSTQSHSVTVNAAGKRSSISASGRWYNQEGIYKVGNEQFNQFNFRVKGDVKVTDWAKIDVNTSYYRRDYIQPFTNDKYTAISRIQHRGQPIYPAYNEDGTPTYYGQAIRFVTYEKGTDYQIEQPTQFTGAVGLELEFIKNVLKLRGDVSYKANRNHQERVVTAAPYYEAPGALGYFHTPEASYKSRWRNNTDYITGNVVATWTPKLGKNHDLNVVGGWNIEDYRYDRYYIQYKGIKYDTLPSYELMDVLLPANQPQDYVTTYGTMGFFGRANYTLLKRYIFEVAARYDGSSKFPANQVWGFFPSASIGWRVSEEPWMEWSRSWMDNFKLRANWGSLGNSNIAAYYFLETIGMDKSTVLFDGSPVYYTSSPSVVPDDLTWETVTTFDVGLDFDFLKSRLSFSGDYYIRDNTNLIVGGPEIPQIFGAGAPKGNYGAIRTKGWEASLSWRDHFKLAGKPFTYSIKGSVWDSRTWVTKFNNTNGNILNFYEGKELGEMWGFRTDGYFLSNEEANNWATDTFHQNGTGHYAEHAGDIRFIDINGDGKIDYGAGTLDDHGDLDRIANTTPHYFYGINLDFKWNGFGLSVFLQGVGKRDWYPDNHSAFFWGMYWRPYGPLLAEHMGDNRVQLDYSTDNWKVINADKNPYWTRCIGYSADRNVGPLGFENDYYLQDAAYLRLKNVTLDYTLPSELTKRISIEQAKFYVSLENMFTFSPIYKHTNMFDPENIGQDSDFDAAVNDQGDGFSYPMLKTVTFGVNVTFGGMQLKSAPSSASQYTAATAAASTAARRSSRKTEVKEVEKIVEVEKVVEKIVEVEKEVEKIVEVPVSTLKGEYSEEVYFVIGEYEIRPDEAIKIGRICQILNDNPEARIVITGYADSGTGTPEFNMELSKNRANAVAVKLVKSGIDAERITCKGIGSDKDASVTPDYNRVAVCIIK